MPNKLNLIGEKYNLLTVIKEADRSRSEGGTSIRNWLCRCECENTTIVSTNKLRRKKLPTKSCGCLNEHHNLAGTKEYVCWIDMKARCYNPSTTYYKHYGGRGITVYPEWINSFTAFISYIGKAPSSKHTLDRIDNEGNYEPGNIKWATKFEQGNNKRSNRLLTFQGKTLTIAQWSKETKIKAETIAKRIDKLGWTVAEALTVPVVPYQKYKRRAS